MSIYQYLLPFVKDATFLNDYITLCATKFDSESIEKHHILPRKIFPEFSDLSLHEWNCSRLPPDRHIVAHWYLYKILRNKEVTHAFRMMVEMKRGISKLTRDEVLIIAENYKLAKIESKQYMSNDCIGKSPAKTVSGDFIGNVSLNDSRWETGEIVGVRKNIKGTYSSAADIFGNKIGNIHLSDPRWATGEIMKYKSPNKKLKNTAAAKTAEGVYVGKISLDDPRWDSGEIVGNGLGRTPKSFSAMDVYGNELGKIIRTDPRWSTGEIIRKWEKDYFLPLNAIPCTLHGIQYTCKEDAKRQLNISSWKLDKLLKIERNINN
jgi:hypothetical protein